MEQEQIIAGNKLIAEFMSDMKDYTPYGEQGDFIDSEICGIEDCDSVFYTWGNMGFNRNWLWLMPVIEKIEALPVPENKDNYEVSIYGTACEIGNFFIQEKGETKIEAAYKAVVTFLTWYNTLNPKP